MRCEGWCAFSEKIYIESDFMLHYFFLALGISGIHILTLAVKALRKYLDRQYVLLVSLLSTKGQTYDTI